MAGSMIGLVDDASGIYFNPAGIVQGQGLEFMIGAAPIVPFFKVTPNRGHGAERASPTSSPRSTCTSPTGSPTT